MSTYENATWVDAEHTLVSVVIDGVPSCVPADPANRHYQEMVALNIPVV